MRVALVTGGTRGIGEAISVALKDAAEQARFVVHWPAVPQVLGQVCVQERQWHGQPFQRLHVLEHYGAPNRNQDTETDGGRKMQWPGVVRRNMAFPKRRPRLVYCIRY